MYIRKMSGEGDSIVECLTVQDVEKKLIPDMKRGWRVVGKTANGTESILQDSKINAGSLMQILERENQRCNELLLIPSITAG